MTVTTAGGTSGGQTFTINPPPAPTLTSVSPNQGIRGTTVAVTLTGTNFVVGATTVTVAGGDVTVNTVVVGSSTSLTANFVLDLASLGGARTVTVTTAGGTSGPQTFTITLPAPGSTDVHLYGQSADLYGTGRRRQHHDSGHRRVGRSWVWEQRRHRVAWAVGRRRPCPSHRAASLTVLVGGQGVGFVGGFNGGGGSTGVGGGAGGGVERA